MLRSPSTSNKNVPDVLKSDSKEAWHLQQKFTLCVFCEKNSTLQTVHENKSHWVFYYWGLTALFLLFAIYSIALKTAHHCISVWLMHSSELEKRKYVFKPFIQVNVLFENHRQYQTPVPSQLCKVVSLVVPFVNTLIQEVQRRSSRLYPGHNTINRAMLWGGIVSIPSAAHKTKKGCCFFLSPPEGISNRNVSTGFCSFSRVVSDGSV